MPDFDAGTIFNEDGSFTDDGRTSLVTLAGEGHEDTKCFEDIKDFAGLCKLTADTKSAVGKKLDNVIQKPGENATDEEKTAYRAALATASGAPEAASEYEFFKSEKLPEGMERSQETEDKFRAIFFEHKVPKETVKALSQVFEEMQITGFNAVVEADKATAAKAADEEQKAFDDGCTSLKTTWPGEKLPVNARISLAAMQKYADPELVKKLTDAKMYENAADLAKWRDAGVPLNTLLMFHKIGLETLDAKLLGGGSGGGGDLTEDEKLRKLYPNTKD